MAGDPVQMIALAIRATERARTARIELRSESWMRLPPTATPPTRALLPGPLAPLRPLARRVGRRVGRGLLTQRAEGVVDLDRRLAAFDYDAYAVLVEAGREWSGRSGRERSTLPDRPAGWNQPLWFLDLLRGVVEAEAMGVEQVRGAACARLAARADLARASAAARDGMAAPDAARVEDLARLPVDCWIDEAMLIRRVRHERPGDAWRTHLTLDLFDFGIAVEREWTHMPTFRRPEGDSG
jgi:hypothetical protein